MIVLVGEPVGIHLPEHPLRRHLKETAAAPGLSHAIGHNLRLETMSQLMRHTVHFLVLDTVGRHPETADEVVVGTAIGRAVEGVHHHDHHLVTVCLRTWCLIIAHEFERITEEMVERLHTVAQIPEIEGHGLAIEGRRIARVVTKAPLPHQDEVIGLDAAFETPLRSVCLQIHASQVFRDIDSLLCVQRYTTGCNDQTSNQSFHHSQFLNLSIPQSLNFSISQFPAGYLFTIISI